MDAQGAQIEIAGLEDAPGRIQQGTVADIVAGRVGQRRHISLRGPGNAGRQGE